MDVQPLPGLSRRSALGLAAGLAAALAAGGCDSTKPTAVKATGARLTKVPTYVAPPKIGGAITSAVEGVPPGYAVLPEKLLTTTKAPFTGTPPVSVLSIAWGNPPSRMSDNAYWQALNAALGTEYKGIFVPFDAYDAKVATTLASGDLPDLMELVPSATSETALRQGAFADLTDLLAGDGIKEFPNLAAIRPDQWRNSAVDGRIYGVPVDLPLADVQWWYRGDWAKQLGYPDPPASPQEFSTIMSAISKGKPGGRQVYGIGAYGGSYGGSMTMFINAMFRVPNDWRLESGGKLVPAIDTDEYEAALGYTRDLWKAGAFHPDALALGDQGAKAIDMFSSGQSGFIKTGIAGGMNAPFAGMVAQNPGMRALLPPGADGKGFAFPRTNGWYARSVIPAKVAKDERRLRQILQVLDFLWAPFGSVEDLVGWFGKEGVTYDLKDGFPVPRADAASANDVIGFAAWTAPFYYHSASGRAPIEAGVAYCEKLVKSSVENPVAGIYSAQAGRNEARMKTLQQEYVNQIVSGRRPLSDLAAYRQEWHQRGGDQIIDELRRGLDKAGG
jgi:putative aldouronate transport system substrate-binding protein